MMNKKIAREFDLSIEICTRQRTIEKLSSDIGIEHYGGINRGETSEFRKIKAKFTNWRWFEKKSKSALSLSKNLSALIKRFENSHIFDPGVLPSDARLTVCIAEYWNIEKAAYPSVFISPKHLSWLAKNSIELNVISYPCE